MYNLRNKLRLYLVLETSLLKLPLKEFLLEVLEGGVTALQVRNKYDSYSEKFEKAGEIKEICAPYEPLFIINDSFEMAISLNADGIHLGPNDISAEYVRRKAPHLVIGVSCNNIHDCLNANKWADYAGIGPYAETSTKKDIRKILGDSGLVENVSHLKIPSVAIGGINRENVSEVLLSGVSGVAVSSYLCSSREPYKDTVKIMDIINERI